MNGVHGDYLARTGNPLAIAMSLRQDGRAVDVASPGNAGSRLMVLVHGLCMNDLQWGGERGQSAQDLARDLGYVPLQLHYNTGLHVATNGRAFAGALESLRAQWSVPIEELVIVGHSMGGLVARSACHYAAHEHHEWMDSLRKLVFLGTPHHGAPLERGGNLLDFMMALSPYSAPFTKLGKLRSEGITDLRHGSVLEEDWADRDRFKLSRDERRPVPLPKGVDCFTVAATRGTRRGLLADRLVGDGLVPLMSALGRHRRADHTLAFPTSHQWIGYELGHMDLLDHPRVYAQLRRWL
jgi:pimeloyl-ACP methyl ester carboxylesterase